MQRDASNQPDDDRPTIADSMGEDATRATIETALGDSGLGHDASTLSAGAQVGKYTVEQVLGTGGMGAVYLATQRKPNRQVALKLIRADAMSWRVKQRLDMEAEILGRLQHPNIAQIYEAGIDQQSGSPFLAMEYIDGQELHDHVREAAPGTTERLRLFCALCDAITHAHSKGVIHRDLKPGNVLVSREGQPKVLDFGIARATDSGIPQVTMQTQVGQLVGTLYYMSPEQAEGDIANLDTRTDVYSLGVVLHELLTGKLPYPLGGKSLHEAVRIIIEQRPCRLSEEDRSLKGDLEVVVLKALEKERERRYQSVAELKADIARVLENKPIHARPPSTLYLTTKFIKRNKRLAVAAACIVLLLSLATSFAVNQWLSKIRARQAVLDNMLLALNEMDVQKGLGPDLSKRLLDLYAQNAEVLFSGDKASLALFYTNLGDAYFGYEDYRRALAMYTNAYEIRTTFVTSPDPILAQSTHNIAKSEFYLNEFEKARDHYLQTLAIYDALYPWGDPRSAEAARTTDHLGSTYVKLGEYESALDMYIRSRDLREQIYGAGSLQVAMSDNSIAWFHVQQGDYETAEPIYRRALSTLQGLEESISKPLWVARAMHSLGNTLIELEQYDEANQMLTGSLSLKSELLSDNKPSVALTLQSLADLAVRTKDYENAETYASQVVDIRRDTADPRLGDSIKILERIRQARTTE